MGTVNVTVTRDYIDYTTCLETTSCGECGIPFAAPEDLLCRCRQDSSINFWCPNGHSLVFRVSENDQLKKQLKSSQKSRDALSAALTHERDQHQAARRQAAAYKGQLTKARKRAGAGVCPVKECHRTVSQLADHMKVKHPGYQP
jgi:hypothetical protein